MPSLSHTPLDATDTASLLSRISDLEAHLASTTSSLHAALQARSQPSQTPPTAPPAPSPSPSPTPRARKPKPTKPFDPSRFSTRFIALKFAYLGSEYNGFEHANGTVPPKPTVEEVLWKALRKVRLISPAVPEGADEGFEVVWGAREREGLYGVGSVGGKDNGEGGKDGGLSGTGIGGGGGGRKRGNGKVALEINWDGCEYSKCGRTDRGVSAFGQVIGIRVRSNRPRQARQKDEVELAVAMHNEVNGEDGQSTDTQTTLNPVSDVSPTPPDLSSPSSSSDRPPPPSFTDASELPYLTLLNAVLPPTIRMLAWCPHPPPNFDARFSCVERRYKYFFTNPGFLPTPGPMGLKFADGRASPVREGWLDVDKMNAAATKLVGTKDYRNFCKIDPSKQMSSCVRRIEFAGIEEWSGGGMELSRNRDLNADGNERIVSLARAMGIGAFVDEGPKVYAFTVHGSAFLWHQVRCMVAVLFLVGQGLEEPSVVDELLDVEKNPGKPHYEMADEAPLVLWDCIFEEGDSSEGNGLEWVHAGDQSTISPLTSKHDGKFGPGGVVSALWSQWRRAKIEELLAGTLMDLTLSQGDGGPLQRGGFRDPATASRSQKIFDGGDSARVAGSYVPIMQRPKMQTLGEQNEKYLNGRKAQRDARWAVDVADDQ